MRVVAIDAVVARLAADRAIPVAVHAAVGAVIVTGCVIATTTATGQFDRLHDLRISKGMSGAVIAMVVA